MNTSEVLDRAADEIERRGWGQGPETWTSKGSGICIEGAIAAVLEFPVVNVPTPYSEFETCPSYLAVKGYIFNDAPGWLWDWNDNTARTASEVIEVLRAAAMVERTREAAVERVSA